MLEEPGMVLGTVLSLLNSLLISSLGNAHNTNKPETTPMFPVTKQFQLITNPLSQALTATGGIGPATIHIGELTSAHFQLQTPKEGGAPVLVHRATDAVSTTLLGKNAKAALHWSCLLSSPIIC